MNALGEPTRRRIVELLVGHERTVGDIAREFEVTRPAISQHLRVLENAQLVSARPDGTRRWYTADPAGLDALRRYVDTLWTESLGELKLAAEREEWQERTRRQLRSRRADETTDG
jgi:DNA-binding transcriptional ArsR family regulator